ncbi:hypothetical protein K439DRAFT_1548514 [Ramaria rubella]|nr:hypothetical protein K439DRAFT_1548514 [Ramaria rubella]
MNNIVHYYVSNHFYIACHEGIWQELQLPQAPWPHAPHRGPATKGSDGNEGFQQEVQQAYDQTNFRDMEQQMVHIDENQEAMARIQTAIDLHDKRLQQASAAENATDDGEPPPEPEHSDQHWALGARRKKVYAHQVQEQKIGIPAFRHFELHFQTFLAETFPEESHPSGDLKARI